MRSSTGLQLQRITADYQHTDTLPTLSEKRQYNMQHSHTVQSKTPILDKLLTELDSTEIYDGSLLYGYWFKPHEACAVNIIFHKNGTFEFKYYIVPNDTTIVDVIKKGTFTISNKDAKKTRIIKMVADDGWDKDVFDGTIYYKKNDLNYYLENEKSGLYLVKGSD